MIFLTVGTQFPFDRLIKAVDCAVERVQINEEIIAQTGNSVYIPRNFRFVPFLEKKQIDKYTAEASAIISHAGMGSIKTSLIYGKSLLVMPRQKKYHEVVNDHQVPLAERFEKLGYLLVAYDEQTMIQKITELKSFVPARYTLNTETVAARISNFLRDLAQAT